MVIKKTTFLDKNSDKKKKQMKLRKNKDSDSDSDEYASDDSSYEPPKLKKRNKRQQLLETTPRMVPP